MELKKVVHAVKEEGDTFWVWACSGVHNLGNQSRSHWPMWFLATMSDMRCTWTKWKDQQGDSSALRPGLGWDVDLDVHPSCPAASAKFPSAQAELGRQWSTQYPIQPNPGLRAGESPDMRCTKWKCLIRKRFHIHLLFGLAATAISVLLKNLPVRTHWMLQIRRGDRTVEKASWGPKMRILIKVAIFCLKKLCQMHQAADATLQGKILQPKLGCPPLLRAPFDGDILGLKSCVTFDRHFFGNA